MRPNSHSKTKLIPFPLVCTPTGLPGSIPLCFPTSSSFTTPNSVLVDGYSPSSHIDHPYSPLTIPISLSPFSHHSHLASSPILISPNSTMPSISPNIHPMVTRAKIGIHKLKALILDLTVLEPSNIQKLWLMRNGGEQLMMSMML